MDQKPKKKTISRRDFIKGFGGGAVGVAVAPHLLPQEAACLQTEEGEVPVFAKKPITRTVNGNMYSLVVQPRDTLLEVLREKLNLTGTKKICGRGECGGCTVLLDNKPVYACMYLAVRADGKTVTTIEGLAKSGQLHPVQEAFITKDGYQCGFCTPGFILSSVALLEKKENPNQDEIKEGLSGNLCRCGNYFRIYDAVSEASKLLRRP